MSLGAWVVKYGHVSRTRQAAYLLCTPQSHDMLQLPTFASPQTFSAFDVIYESNIRFINDSIKLDVKSIHLKMDGDYNKLSL